MKYVQKIKKFESFINEMFDSEDLKNRLEIPYLQGDLLKSFKRSVDENIISKFVNRMAYLCPFIKKMKFKLTGSLFSVGLNEIIDKHTIAYWLLEVRGNPIETTAHYSCTIDVVVMSKGKRIFSKSFNKVRSRIEEISKLVNNEGYKSLIEINKFTNKEFGVSLSDHLEIEDNQMPNLN